MRLIGLVVFLFSASVTNAQTGNSIAEYPGGADAFFAYIRSSLQYPADAHADSIQGVVLVGFTINETGVVSTEGIEVVKSLSPSCDAEALRLVRASQAWHAAKENGVAVSQRIVFPIEFKFP
jgi:periplasmic protein TonB